MLNFIDENIGKVLLGLFAICAVVALFSPPAPPKIIEGNLQDVEFVAGSFNVPDSIIVSFTDGRVLRLKGTAYGKQFVKGKMNRISTTTNDYVIGVVIPEGE